MRSFVIGFLRFWRDFVIGDDWRIAAGVTLVLGVGGIAVASTSLSDTAIALAVLAALVTVVFATIVRPR
jgi:multisubunit Na+/H+ antiporter MnhF subunit